MELKRYIFSQVGYWLIVSTVSLIGIVWLGQALQLIELLVNKGAAMSQFLTLTILAIPLWLMAILPIGGLAGVIMVFNKLQNDREIVAMYAAGLSNFKIAQAPLAIGGLLTLFLYINSVFILPLTFNGYKTIINSLRTSAPIVTLQEGVFTDITEGLTIFIDQRRTQNSFENIFAHDTRSDKKIVEIIAESGIIDVTVRPPQLKFFNGIRSEYEMGSPNAAVLEFKSYNLTLTSEVQNNGQRHFDYNELPITTLLAGVSERDHYSREMRAEGHYRLASPLLGLSLVLIGVVSVLNSPYRRSGTWKFMLGAVVVAILVQVATITARGLTIDYPSVFPLIYLASGGPALIGLWMLRQKSYDIRVVSA